MNKGVCYLSSSYSRLTEHYGFASVIIYQEKKYIIKGSVNNGMFFKMQSTGAAIHGCIEAVNKALKLGIKELDIYNSVRLVETLATGKEKTDKEPLLFYIKFMKSIQNKIKINFIKICKDVILKEYQEAKEICREMLGI